MNEFLNSIRSVHLILMTVSIAVVLFSLSPRDSDRYAAAQAEAEFLKQLDFDDYEHTLYKVHETALTSVWSDMRSLLAGAPYELKIDPGLDLSAPLLAAWPTPAAVLGDISHFIDDWSDYELVIPEWRTRDDWEYAFGSRSSPEKPAHCFAQRTNLLTKCEPLAPGGKLLSAAVFDRLAKEEFDDILRETKSQFHAKKRDLLLLLTVEKNDGSQEVYAARSVAPRSVFIKPDDYAGSPSDWFSRKRTEYESSKPSHLYVNPIGFWVNYWRLKYQMWKIKNEGLRAPASGLTMFQIYLPALGGMLDQVESRTPKEAAAYLGEKAAQARQSLTLLGLQLDERIVAVVAPFAILCVSLYLLSHLTMLRSALTRSRSPPGAALLYPWMGLYEDRFSRFLTWLTIGVLPTSATFLLCAMQDQSFDLMYVTSLLVVGCIGVSGICSLMLLKEIRLLANLPIQETVVTPVQTAWPKPVRPSHQRTHRGLAGPVGVAKSVRRFSGKLTRGRTLTRRDRSFIADHVLRKNSRKSG